MKARVKATGKIVEVKYSRQMGPDAVYRDLVTGEHYMDFELSFHPEDGTPDYWTRLEHQYVGMAMQGILAHEGTEFRNYLPQEAMDIAHAHVEKMKEEKKWIRKKNGTLLEDGLLYL